MGTSALGRLMLPGHGGHGGSFWTLDVASTLNQKGGWILKTQQAMISKMVGCLAGYVNLVSETKEVTRGISAACCSHTSPTT